MQKYVFVKRESECHSDKWTGLLAFEEGRVTFVAKRRTRCNHGFCNEKYIRSLEGTKNDFVISLYQEGRYADLELIATCWLKNQIVASIEYLANDYLLRFGADDSGFEFEAKCSYRLREFPQSLMSEWLHYNKTYGEISVSRVRAYFYK